MRVIRSFIPREDVELVQKHISPVVGYLLDSGYADVIRVDPDDQEAPLLRRIHSPAHERLRTVTRRRKPVEGFDSAMLVYGLGGFRPMHLDSPLVGGRPHWRVIVCVEQPVAGGAFVVEHPRSRRRREVVLAPGDAVLLRVDAERHGVEQVHMGRRVVLSIGGEYSRAGPSFSDLLAKCPSIA